LQLSYLHERPLRTGPPFRSGLLVRPPVTPLSPSFYCPLNPVSLRFWSLGIFFDRLFLSLGARPHTPPFSPSTFRLLWKSRTWILPLVSPPVFRHSVGAHLQFFVWRHLGGPWLSERASCPVVFPWLLVAPSPQCFIVSCFQLPPLS